MIWACVKHLKPEERTGSRHIIALEALIIITLLFLSLMFLMAPDYVSDHRHGLHIGISLSGWVKILQLCTYCLAVVTLLSLDGICGSL